MRFFVSILSLSLICQLTLADEKGIEFFESKIRPVLVQHCYECHAADSKAIKGNLLLDSAVSLRQGGDTGPAISPEHPEESLLLESLKYESFEMPPAGKLPDAVIKDFETWLKMGAPDPRTDSAPPSIGKQGIDFDAAREFWAFQPPESHVVPTVEAKGWTHNWIDHFILSRLEEQGISPIEDANRATLLRRLAFDLTGLPPTAGALQTYLNDDQKSLDAYIDQLLSSQQFGEHWGRHWLDVARYADSNGGDFNATFHNAWRYRNYIIDSYNQDRPFNEIIVEHIAGDLLPFESEKQRERQLVATGFLMMGTKMLSERDKEKLTMDVVDEQISSIGSAFLAMTMGCARCHDHKFDPIPTSDYYAMAGILKSTHTLEGEFQQYVSRWVQPELPIDPKHAEELKTHNAAVRDLKAKLKLAQAEIKKLEENSSRSSVLQQGIVIDNVDAVLVGEWKESTHTKSYVGAGYVHDDKQDLGKKSVTFKTTLPKSGEYEVRVSYTGIAGRATNVPVLIMHANGEEIVKVNQAQSPPIQNLFKALGIWHFNTEQPALVKISNEATDGYVVVDAVQFVPKSELETEMQVDSSGNLTLVENAKSELKQLENSLKELEKNAPPPAPLALAVQEAKECTDCSICIRGEHKNLGETVPRGFLTVASYENSPSIEKSSSGRMELAQWIADSRNPLTARVYVNRVWQHLLGEGIVRSVDNFGHLGQRPSHPELLDQLAVEFIQNNWSTKWLVREIVLSHTYQLSSQYDSDRWNIDPENALLWRAHRKRLSAEAIRDAILSASAELELSPGIEPMKGMGDLVTVNKVDDSGYEQKQSQKRTIYDPVVRNELPSLMRVFDFADPDFVSGRRAETTVPAQALWMLNGPFVKDKSALITKRLFETEAQNLEERVDDLYVLTLGRPAQAQEKSVAVEFLSLSDDTNALNNVVVWTDLTHAILASSAFRMLD